MRRGLVVLVAAVAAVAGCGGDAEDDEATATVTATVTAAAPSVSASPSSVPVASADAAVPSASAVTPTTPPPGLACAEVMTAMSGIAGNSWVLGGEQGSGSAGEAGIRTCSGEASSTGSTPPGILTVTLYRRLDTDTPQKILDRARSHSEGCETDLPDPPDGVGLALSCTDTSKSTLVSTVTTFVLETGFVTVRVQVQNDGSAAARATSKTFTEKVSRQGAVAAISMN